MNPARRVFESAMMRATKARRLSRRRAAARRSVVKPSAKPVPAAPQQVLYRVCKPGWAVVVEKGPGVLGTRFVCPFCPLSHRVPGPVRGFRKLRRSQWAKLRRVLE